MRRIGFMICLLLTACGGPAPSASQPSASPPPAANATARPPANTATPWPAKPTDPPVVPSAAAEGALVWTRQERAGIAVVVTNIDDYGDMILMNGWFENLGAAPVQLRSITFAVVGGSGPQLDAKPGIPSGLVFENTIPPGGRQGFANQFQTPGRQAEAFALHVMPPGADAPIVYRSAAPAPSMPQQSLDVYAALGHPEDLPAGFVWRPASFTAADPPSSLKTGGMPRPIDLASIVIEAEDGGSAVALLALYGSAEEGLPLYNQVALHAGAEPLAGVGERAVTFDGPDPARGGDLIEGAFMRCNAVFYLQDSPKPGQTPLTGEELAGYLERIDARVAAACGQTGATDP